MKTFGLITTFIVITLLKIFHFKYSYCYKVTQKIKNTCYCVLPFSFVGDSEGISGSCSGILGGRNVFLKLNTKGSSAIESM